MSAALQKPLARVMLFANTSSNEAWAWTYANSIDVWDCERITIERTSPQWTEAAFVACVRAFRRLQAKHPEVQMVVDASLVPSPGLIARRIG